jgi:hypothetical protein
MWNVGLQSQISKTNLYTESPIRMAGSNICPAEGQDSNLISPPDGLSWLRFSWRFLDVPRKSRGND